MPVPVAIIVCEGDIDTIAHIAKALERKLPVIIMKGSGTAADVVVDYLEKYFTFIVILPLNLNQKLIYVYLSKDIFLKDKTLIYEICLFLLIWLHFISEFKAENYLRDVTKSQYFPRYFTYIYYSEKKMYL